MGFWGGSPSLSPVGGWAPVCRVGRRRVLGTLGRAGLFARLVQSEGRPHCRAAAWRPALGPCAPVAASQCPNCWLSEYSCPAACSLFGRVLDRCRTKRYLPTLYLCWIHKCTDGAHVRYCAVMVSTKLGRGPVAMPTASGVGCSNLGRCPTAHTSFEGWPPHARPHDHRRWISSQHRIRDGLVASIDRSFV